MTGRRMLRLIVAFAAMAASVTLASVPAAAAHAEPTPASTPTPGPVADDPSDPVRAAEYWLDGAGIRDAWKVTRGKGTTIAVIDTGIGRPPGDLR